MDCAMKTVDDVLTKYPFVVIEPRATIIYNVFAEPIARTVKIPDGAIIFKIRKSRGSDVVAWAVDKVDFPQTDNIAGGGARMVTDSDNWYECVGLNSINISGINCMCSIEFFVGN